MTRDRAEELIRASDGEAREAPGSLRAAVANAMVGLKKKHYGRGPTGAKAWILDDYVFVAMEGGLTIVEETLLGDGKEEEVRQYRLSFQETVRATACGAIEDLMGRRVLDYHSQIIFHPVRSFEIFVLEPEATG